MRLWSLHPRHLDRAGLVAGWREALLAQAVLAGRTSGYQHHPQLTRFRAAAEPLEMMAAYLHGLHDEASVRGYRFDASKIIGGGSAVPVCPVTDRQLHYEWAHLGRKLALRSPADAERWRGSAVTPHPIFTVVPGDIESWERP